MKHLELDFFDQDGTEMVRVKEQTHRREEFGKDGTFAFHATNGFSFFSGNFPDTSSNDFPKTFCVRGTSKDRDNKANKVPSPEWKAKCLVAEAEYNEWGKTQ